MVGLVGLTLEVVVEAVAVEEAEQMEAILF
jgi:hypothetical protein